MLYNHNKYSTVLKSCEEQQKQEKHAVFQVESKVLWEKEENIHEKNYCKKKKQIQIHIAHNIYTIGQIIMKSSGINISPCYYKRKSN